MCSFKIINECFSSNFCDHEAGEKIFSENIFPSPSEDVTKTGSGERGAGSGERGAGSGERGTGNGERGTGNGERKSGNELSAETSIKIQNGR